MELSLAITEKIPQPLVGERLDRVVAFITSCSRSQAALLIESGNVHLSGQIVTSKRARVLENQIIVIDDSSLLAEGVIEPDPGIEISVVYQDDHVLLIDKQAGLVVHPGSGNDSGTLVNGLLSRYPEIASVGQSSRPGIVHRLDKDTSGLMIVARTPDAYEVLIEMMENHLVERGYLALVHGLVEHDRGVIDAPISRSHANSIQMAVSALGRDAVTHYQVRERYTLPMAATFLRLQLETGRTHQIRVHLSAIGHSIVGDKLYSKRDPLGLKRPFLHSCEIRFTHPVTGETIEHSSPLPTELGDYLELFS